MTKSAMSKVKPLKLEKTCGCVGCGESKPWFVGAYCPECWGRRMESIKRLQARIKADAEWSKSRGVRIELPAAIGRRRYV